MRITPEQLITKCEAHDRCIRIRGARQAPESTPQTRVALVAFERGLSVRHLEQFYYTNRKGAKRRYFNYEAFAEKHGIDIHWIWDGDLRGHPRDLRKQARKNNRRPAHTQEGGAA